MTKVPKIGLSADVGCGIAKSKNPVVGSKRGIRLKAQGARKKIRLILPCALHLVPCAFHQSEIRNPK